MWTLYTLCTTLKDTSVLGCPRKIAKSHTKQLNLSNAAVQTNLMIEHFSVDNIFQTIELVNQIQVICFLQWVLLHKIPQHLDRSNYPVNLGYKRTTQKSEPRKI